MKLQLTSSCSAVIRQTCLRSEPGTTRACFRLTDLNTPFCPLLLTGSRACRRFIRCASHHHGFVYSPSYTMCDLPELRLQGEIQLCLIRCVGGGTECAIECIMGDTGLSRDCSTCWANMGLCTLQNCVLECIIPTSAACAACSELNCFPAAVECTGIPMWAFPRP